MTARTPVPLWWFILVSVVAFIVLAVAGLFYTNAVAEKSERELKDLQRTSERRWCRLLVTLDDANNPPTNAQSELQRRIAAEIHQLRTELGC